MAYDHLPPSLKLHVEDFAAARTRARILYESKGLSCETSSWHTAAEDCNVRLRDGAASVHAHVVVEHQGKVGGKCFLVEIVWRNVQYGAPNERVGRYSTIEDAADAAVEALQAAEAARRLGGAPVASDRCPHGWRDKEACTICDTGMST